MTLTEVKTRLAEIEEIKWDDESAHSKEDELFYCFCEAVMDGKYSTIEEAAEVAKELYKVRDIDFCRWYA